jgi:type II secretory pathway predicted ATPase ExeA
MTIDKLRAHYGFTRTPFGRDLAPGQLFAARGHQEAVARLAWLIDEHAIGVLTGEVSAGKTVAARGIHYHLVTALGGVPRFHRPALIAQTAELLAAQRDERRKHTILIVDEGHLLANDQLEQLRLLTNLDMDAASPLTLVLLGQPTLRRRLKLGHFAALDQRIGLRYHLTGLPLDETAGYLAHHLRLAGRSDPLFSDDAVAVIHRTSRGIPRAVNNLAVQALIAAYADGKGIVDESSATTAVTEVTAD